MIEEERRREIKTYHKILTQHSPSPTTTTTTTAIIVINMSTFQPSAAANTIITIKFNSKFIHIIKLKPFFLYS
jgi:hypothetical protein